MLPGRQSGNFLARSQFGQPDPELGSCFQHGDELRFAGAIADQNRRQCSLDSNLRLRETFVRLLTIHFAGFDAVRCTAFRQIYHGLLALNQRQNTRQYSLRIA